MLKKRWFQLLLIVSLIVGCFIGIDKYNNWKEKKAEEEYIQEITEILTQYSNIALCVLRSEKFLYSGISCQFIINDNGFLNLIISIPQTSTSAQYMYGSCGHAAYIIQTQISDRIENVIVNYNGRYKVIPMDIIIKLMRANAWEGWLSQISVIGHVCSYIPYDRYPNN